MQVESIPIQSDEIVIIPNPVMSTFSVFSELAFSKLEILELNWKSVFTKQYDTETKKFELNQLFIAGTYIVRAYHQKNSCFGKINNTSMDPKNMTKIYKDIYNYCYLQ